MYWDPPKEALTIPFIDITVMWYGILFALGFVIGYFILIPLFIRVMEENQRLYGRDVTDWSLLAQQLKTMLPPWTQSAKIPFHLSENGKRELADLPSGEPPSESLKDEILKNLNSAIQNPTLHITRRSLSQLFNGSIATLRDIATMFADRVTWLIVIGTVIGARLGHVIFYDWPYYAAHPLEILMIRNGGLASHGGTLGVMIFLLVFLKCYKSRFPEMSLVLLLDLLVIPTAFVAFCIRLGNLMNQEILGTETTMPWGIIFGHPADGSIPAVRHPVQLYEAIANLATFVILYSLWQKNPRVKRGLLSGLFFVLVFGSRFILEFFKAHLASWLDGTSLQMGQYLSIPFVLLGVLLIFVPWKDSKLLTSVKFSI